MPVTPAQLAESMPEFAGQFIPTPALATCDDADWRTHIVADDAVRAYRDGVSREEDSSEDHDPDQSGGLDRVEVRGVGLAPHLTLDLAPRLNLLVGDNGLGKTFLLDITWWALSGRWRGGEKAKPNAEAQNPQILMRGAGKRGVSVFDPRRSVWPRGDSWPRPLGPVVYARVDGFSVWDPLRHDLFGQGDPRSLPALELSAGQLERNEAEKPQCNGLWVDWDFWRHDEPSVVASFFRLVQKLFDFDREQRAPIEPGPTRRLWPKDSDLRVPTLIFDYGEVSLAHLSAGMRRILGLAYTIVWTWKRHTEAANQEGRPPANHFIVLLDEVESHLHPKWQRMILPALREVLEGLSDEIDIQLLVTTHSPFVLASLEASFDERRDRLFHFDVNEDRQVYLDVLPWAKHGEVGNWLDSPVFQVQPISVEAEQAIEAAKALLRKSTPASPELQTPEAVQRALAEHVVPEHGIWRRWQRVFPAAERVHDLQPGARA